MASKLILPCFTILLGQLGLIQGQGEGLLQPDEFPPTCAGCYCVPEEDSECPVDSMPEISFAFTEQLKSMVWTNPIQINCNPYLYNESKSCTLTDEEGNPVEEGLNSSAFSYCGIMYHDGTDINQTSSSEVSRTATTANQCKTSYTTKSFATREELEEEGYVVTHYGGTRLELAEDGK